jgi:hypothetical protein
MKKYAKDRKKGLRQFSAGLAVILTAIAVINFFLHGRIYIYLLPAAVLVLLVGMFLPGWIKPLYWLMTRIGNVVNWIITNLILAFMFYIIFTLISLIMRLTGKQPLDLKFHDRRDSYWIKRENPEFEPEGFERQY